MIRERLLHAINLPGRVRMDLLAHVRQRRATRRGPAHLALLQHRRPRRRVDIVARVIALEIRRLPFPLEIRRAEGVAAAAVAADAAAEAADAAAGSPAGTGTLGFGGMRAEAADEGASAAAEIAKPSMHAGEVPHAGEVRG